MSNKPFIDLDGKIKRREYANPKDYKIIKIPYKNDGKFVRINMNISTIHEGE